MRDNLSGQVEDNKITTILNQEAIIETSGCQCAIGQPAEES